tara:strand:- start:403 stop:684 length:282 start_codon:yes stop_codon:yes gene_type:complete
MKNTIYISAPQATTTLALSILKGFKGQLPALRIHGRYALATELKPEARPIIEAALAYCAELAAEIGEDTQLGCCGTPAVWATDFRLDLERLTS